MDDTAPSPPPDYRHTQTANTTLVMALTVLFGITLALVLVGPHPALLVAGLLVATALLLAHSLTVSVDPETLELRLGNGLLRRKISLSDVVGIDSTRVEGLLGLPLRRTPCGWIYAVAAGDAVSIRLRDETTCVVGTDDAVSLLLAIRAQLPPPASARP